ncbi:hypothetical protein CPter291_0554 [Collimonas pratensis]|uniref:Uncharacterized protein n=1 Tax=Collimonas pratensis TaxID=279113 RepID=A0ABM5Z1A7_9BURK|nr:hypothetical protein CPter291_0554 [Collimonas pratensis]
MIRSRPQFLASAVSKFQKNAGFCKTYDFMHFKKKQLRVLSMTI